MLRDKRNKNYAARNKDRYLKNKSERAKSDGKLSSAAGSDDRRA